MTLDGEWLMVLFDEGGEMTPPLGGTTVTLKVEGDEISGNAGVNRYFGKISNGVVVEPLATTMMAGPAETMEQERRFLSLLGGARLTRDEESLLVRRDGETVMRLERLQRSILGTWRLIALANEKGGIVGATTEGEATLAFGSDGELTGSGGCNRFRAGYTVHRDALDVSAVVSTRMTCSSEAVVAQERRLFELLEKASRFELSRGGSGDLLDIFATSGSRVLQFEALPVEPPEHEKTSN